MDQFSMFESPELTVLETIRPVLDTVLAENRLGPEYLSFEKRGQYWSIVFNTSSVVARLGTGRSKYLEIPTAPLAFSAMYRSYVGNLNSAYTRLPLVSLSQVKDYDGMLVLSLKHVIDQIPKEYDCCSRYRECSDSKACIHPDIEFSLKCGYRRIMRDGRIFYGKNRNI